MLTTNITETGTRFELVPDVCVIFISTFDIFKSGLPMYHVRKIITETGKIVEDGLTEIYANTVVYDSSKFSELMKIFTKNDAYDIEKFPATSKAKARLKENEGGKWIMDETLQRWRDEWISEGEERGEKRGKKEGANEEKIRIAKDMKKEGLAYSLIAKLTGLSEKKILAL